MAGIDAHVAAPCGVPVAIQVTMTMTIAGSRTRRRTTATMMIRRLTGIFGFLTAGVLEPCGGVFPVVVMREA